jgi:hypothetical protein
LFVAEDLDELEDDEVPVMDLQVLKSLIVIIFSQLVCNCKLELL